MARFYTKASAAKKLRTHRPRLMQLIALAGVKLPRVGGNFVIDEETFAVLKSLHRTTPKGKPGRPRKPSE